MNPYGRKERALLARGVVDRESATKQAVVAELIPALTIDTVSHDQGLSQQGIANVSNRPSRETERPAIPAPKQRVARVGEWTARILVDLPVGATVGFVKGAVRGFFDTFRTLWEEVRPLKKSSEASETTSCQQADIWGARIGNGLMVGLTIGGFFYPPLWIAPGMFAFAWFGSHTFIGAVRGAWSGITTALKGEGVNPTTEPLDVWE